MSLLQLLILFINIFLKKYVCDYPAGRGNRQTHGTAAFSYPEPYLRAALVAPRARRALGTRMGTAASL